MIFVDNLLNTPGCRVNTPEVCHSDPSACDTLEQCLAHRSAVAAPLKARARSGQKVLGYRGIVIAWWDYVTAANADWWIKDPLTGEVGPFDCPAQVLSGGSTADTVMHDHWRRSTKVCLIGECLRPLITL